MDIMINKLVVLAVAAALSSIGCAKQAPPVRQPELASHVDPAPASIAKPSAGYSVSLTGGWTLVEQVAMEGDEPQRVAEYELKVREDLELAAYVVQTKLDKDDAAKFLDMMREEVEHTEGVKLIGQRMAKHGAVEAYESLTAMKVSQGVALILAASLVDGKGNGFFVTCGGNIKDGETVLEACRPFIKSFSVTE